MKTNAANTPQTRGPGKGRGARRRTKRSRAVQGEFFARTWGGPRKGAGRKRRAARELVPHRSRPTFPSRFPVHVTLRLADGLPSLRAPTTYRALLAALAGGCERFGMRVVHWTAPGNHMHLIVEAYDRHALSRGMQGLGVRLARALNRVWRRRGGVLADRYHARPLRSPREVRNALGYVLRNARKHGIAFVGADPCSSGAWFDGWLQARCGGRAEAERPGWLRTARTWLLGHGWRRWGLLDIDGWPGGP